MSSRESLETITDLQCAQVLESIVAEKSTQVYAGKYVNSETRIPLHKHLLLWPFAFHMHSHAHANAQIYSHILYGRLRGGGVGVSEDGERAQGAGHGVAMVDYANVVVNDLAVSDN